MNIAARMGFSVVPGAIVTFLLLVLMFTLIVTGAQKLDEAPARKIADIFQPEREVTANVKEMKPEKPETPEEPPPDIPQQQLDVDVPDTAISMASPVTANLDIGLGGGFARDSDYIPVYVPQPQYPRRAQSRGVGGYAVVKVIITTTGGVRDPVLVEEDPEGYGFGTAAVRAAEKLKYNPRVVDGVPQEVPDVIYKFSFAIEQ